MWVVLNEEWGLTAVHMVQMMATVAKEKEKSKEYAVKLAEIEADESLEPGKRKKRIRELDKEYEPKRLTTDWSQWLGYNMSQIGTVHADSAIDLAAFQYRNAPDDWGSLSHT